MAIHKLVRTQLINSTIEELWDFFSSPANLAAITPAYMNFRITSANEGKGIYNGQIITYKISPLLGIPLLWMTEITDIVHHNHFTDVQKRGPYKFWHHQHFFEQKDDGVLMTDIVHYQLPMSILGYIAHFLFIKRQLDDIFDYRYIKIEDIFHTHELLNR